MKNCNIVRAVSTPRLNTLAALAVSVTALVASNATAAVVINAPTGLAEGAKFRIIFVSNAQTTANRSTLDYNNFVTNDAQGATYNGATIAWKALVSVFGGNDGRTNIGGYGSSTALYRVDGTMVASSMTGNSGGLWSGALMNAANLDINGNAMNRGVITGTAWNGTAGSPVGLGPASMVGLGLSNATSSSWVNQGPNPWQQINPISMASVYGVSEELTVAAPVPAPGAAALIGLAGAFGGRRRKA